MPHAQTDNQSQAPERHLEKQGREFHLRRLLEEPGLQGTLTKSLCLHNERESASFHIPGHKGRLRFRELSSFHDFASEFDVTELDDLDDLSYPTGVLRDLERRVANLYGVENSIISVSGASGGLLAAIIAVAKRGSELLVPRNAHRSVIHALVLSGLKPRWYEPEWNSEWAVWQNVTPAQLDASFGEGSPDAVAGVLVVSPTYAGALSDIKALAEVSHKHGVPLIVDEAQGAHFFSGLNRLQSPVADSTDTETVSEQSRAFRKREKNPLMPVSACQSGADLVVHSFHKTIGAMTQTGAVHIATQKYVSAEDVRAALRLVSTSSPSYVLLSSIEQAILVHESEEGLQKLNSIVHLSNDIRRAASSKLHVYELEGGVDPLHVLLGSPLLSGRQLYNFFVERGIFCEAVLGSGCLLMLGAGTVSSDIELVIAALDDLPSASAAGTMICVAKPQPIEQVISPREAFFAPTEIALAKDAGGRISADCLAPCPPGMPVCVPGARVAQNEGLSINGHLRVLLESG